MKAEELFGERLKELRRDRDMTQWEFARIFEPELVQTTIALYESGRREMGLKNIISICKKFNVSSDYLLGLTDNPTPTWKSSSKESFDLEKILKKEEIRYKNIVLRKKEKEVINKVIDAILGEDVCR